MYILCMLCQKGHSIITLDKRTPYHSAIATFREGEWTIEENIIGNNGVVKGVIPPAQIRVIQSCRPSFGTHMSNNSVGVSYTRRLFFSPAQSYHTDFFQNEKKKGHNSCFLSNEMR